MHAEPEKLTMESQAEAASASDGVAEGEPLSKNARKRLLKIEQKASRKEKRREEKRMRRELHKARDEDEDAGASSSAITIIEPRRALTLEEHCDAAWATWRRLGTPRCVLAPMVNQSELAFRMLARRHGAGLTYTPMLHSTRFAAEEQYRSENFDEHSADRPLVVQFCGDDPATLLAAARHVQSRCDAIDLNCGCPQAIARRGHYGAFLLDEPDLIVRIVQVLSTSLAVPVFVKIRVLPAADGSVDTQATIELARRLQAAGCSLLTVHGRTRVQKCACECDWATIAAVKAALSIPVVANGGVEAPEDLDRCLAATRCDAVMTSEAALENPAMVGGVPTSRVAQVAVAREYMALARAHPPRGLAVLKAHFFKLLFMALEVHKDLRERLGSALDAESLYAVVTAACEREEAEALARPAEMAVRCDREGAPSITWYRRHRSSTRPAEAAPAEAVPADAAEP